MNKIQEKIKVSIIIAAYNVESLIVKCLNSLINQTLKEIEIIVVDDGSTDNTLEVARRFLFDERVIIITQTNQKQGAARNRALDIAKGEYITFVDSDDWVNDEYCELLYKTAKKYNADIAAASATRDYKNKVKKHLELLEENLYTGTEEMINALKRHLETHSKMYRFEPIKNLRFPEGVFYEDAPYTIRAINELKTLVTVPNAHYHYYSNPKSTIKQKITGKNKEDKIITSLDVINYAEEKNINLPKFVIYKDSHLLWTIKHYKNYEEFYLFGIKLFRKNREFKFIN